MPLYQKKTIEGHFCKQSWPESNWVSNSMEIILWGTPAKCPAFNHQETSLGKKAHGRFYSNLYNHVYIISQLCAKVKSTLKQKSPFQLFSMKHTTWMTFDFFQHWEKQTYTREKDTKCFVYEQKTMLTHKQGDMIGENLTLAISSGVRAPFMSCLFANISRDAPDSLWQMSKQIRGFTRKEQMNKKRKKTNEQKSEKKKEQEQDMRNTLH